MGHPPPQKKKKKKSGNNGSEKKDLKYLSKLKSKSILHLNTKPEDLPGGRVDRNLPDNAEDTGSIPGLGRLHMPQSN